MTKFRPNQLKIIKIHQNFIRNSTKITKFLPNHPIAACQIADGCGKSGKKWEKVGKMEKKEERRRKRRVSFLV